MLDSEILFLNSIRVPKFCLCAFIGDVCLSRTQRILERSFDVWVDRFSLVLVELKCPLISAEISFCEGLSMNMARPIRQERRKLLGGNIGRHFREQHPSLDTFTGHKEDEALLAF